MSVTFSIAVYFMIWWIVLFAVLPFGRSRSQEETGNVVPGSEASAPDRPRFLRVFVLTTILASLIFGGFYWLRTSGMSLDDIPFLRPPSAR
ncbi:DUF1467 family protein [Roseibium sp.]|uniref:DUF1467 family protein n=1 Tax=Roseibium sp. TaxID=1936156 RepID=UPI003A983550